MATAGTTEARLLPRTSSAALTGAARSGSSVRRSFSPATLCEEMRIGTKTGMSRKMPNQSTTSLSTMKRTGSTARGRLGS